MTVTITLSIKDQPDQSIQVNPDALDDVRFDFNPSGDRDVVLVKALSAGLLTVCQKPNGKTGRWMAIARTHIETAQMFAVKAVTFK